jgi:hypothetical protein
MEAEVPVDAPVDVTAVAIEGGICWWSWSTKYWCIDDDAIIIEIKVIDYNNWIDS